MSLHGGCPPLDDTEEKWSANLWIWNGLWTGARAAAETKPLRRGEDVGILFQHELPGRGAVEVSRVTVSSDEGSRDDRTKVRGSSAIPTVLLSSRT